MVRDSRCGGAAFETLMGFCNLGWTLVGLYVAALAVGVVIASGVLLAAPAAGAAAVCREPSGGDRQRHKNAPQGLTRVATQQDDTAPPPP